MEDVDPSLTLTENSNESLTSPRPDAEADASATTVLADRILKLASLIEEQNSLLRRNDLRKDAADKSHQPIPEVPATSSSAWNALLRSTLADSIQPKADGWRSGLDALLVFLGLFSAIVTAFIIPSLGTLKQDEIARTNEILSNLTNIIVMIGGTNATRLNLPEPAVFVPEADDVRLNVYLTLSLILSLSIGALAIACRGFLNLVSWSQYTKAVERLTDIRTRWRAAEKWLGPAIESLPQLLIIPVLLFIVGLVDSLFSTALQLAFPPVSILVTSGISVALVASVAVLMGFTVVDGSIRPTTSPFQSTLARGLNVSLVQMTRSLTFRARKTVLAAFRDQKSTRRSPPFTQTPPLSSDSMNIYHEILQATRDDDILDEASAALFHVIRQRTNHQTTNRFFKRIPVDLLPQESATLLHLLSPEASVRSNRTAAQVIVEIATTGRARPLRYSQSDLGRLIPSLAFAARRAYAPDAAGLWDSEFLQAMALVANLGTNVTDYPAAIVFLGAEHWSWKYLAPSELSEIFAFIFQVINSKITEALADADDPTRDEASAVDAVLSGNSDLPVDSKRVPVDPRNALAALLYIPPHPPQRLIRLIVSWLLRIHPPARVISAAQEHLETIQGPDWLHRLGHREYSMVPRLVSTLALRCLDLDTPAFTAHAPLALLCTKCLLHTPSIRSRPPAGFVFFARPVLTALLAALAHLDLRAPESSALLRDVVEIRHSVEADLLWKDGKAEVLREFDRLIPVGISKTPIIVDHTVLATDRRNPSGNASQRQMLSDTSESPPRMNSNRTHSSSHQLSPGGAAYDAAEAGLYARPGS
ncbi:hypothetical protein C8R44DRAFT_364587 [Mycena epipterygia]|nr:hypothetical protein C8R44DRAFT_364587 [Mycena epipterygia]